MTAEDTNMPANAEEAAASVIRLESVTKRFGAVTAVDNVTLDLRENEFFALLGPSGCGKTTLLRMIAGFETLNEGRILLDGQDIAPLRPNRRPINLMFQSFALFPHMSVRANVSYGLEMEGLRGADLGNRVDRILGTTQLMELADRKPDQLSGGQRQRVALARALVKEPRVLLLDEPLAALDKKLREQMQLELKRLQHEVGITFIVVTHDQEEALVMADRIALMRGGEVKQCATPQQLYEHPNSRFVADFIGVMNFLDGEAVDAGVGVPGLGTLHGEGADKVRPGARACLAIRPERLRVTPAARAEEGMEGHLTDIAYHGQDIGLHIALAEGQHRLVARVSAAADGAADFAVGDRVRVGWDAAHARILPDDRDNAEKTGGPAAV
ncbi:polyamine ABC transporter ATP-binding protein [Roseovarius salis]|uniref:ABC transporter ATP-binding protein n=1 Tax=Roseovarius salis TaxID=3376063 RepID=UPI0037C921AE